MDVFAITCQKHICYIAADGNDEPFCPIDYRDTEYVSGIGCKDEWHIFKSDAHFMLLTESVSEAVRDLNGAINRLNNKINPKP